MSTPANMVMASQQAVQNALWPGKESCFQLDSAMHCAVVKNWMRHPGLNTETAAVPSQAFLPRTIEIRTGDELDDELDDTPDALVDLHGSNNGQLVRLTDVDGRALDGLAKHWHSVVTNEVVRYVKGTGVVAK